MCAGAALLSCGGDGGRGSGQSGRHACAEAAQAWCRKEVAGWAARREPRRDSTATPVESAAAEVAGRQRQALGHQELADESVQAPRGGCELVWRVARRGAIFSAAAGESSRVSTSTSYICGAPREDTMRVAGAADAAKNAGLADWVAISSSCCWRPSWPFSCSSSVSSSSGPGRGWQRGC